MSAETPIAFGELLKEYRLTAGLTQEALAERAGVSARNLQNLERGENRPLKDTARRLAAALGLGERDHALLLSAVVPVPRRRSAAGPPPAGQPITSPPAGPDAPLPVGMLAVLVADLRGYTAFTHQQGDAAGAALATRFAALAGEAVTAEKGRVVEVRGDEVLAAFRSARAALRAALGLLARCAAAAGHNLPVRAGVGVDVGEPVAVGEGYRGAVLNTAARLCAQAGPGEVLASEAVVGLARRLEGVVYQDRGELALKGIPRPVRAWLVRAGEEEPGPVGAAIAGASAGAPPAAAARHNLPAALSSFIGRAHEQARVRELLASQRLVTLVGSGGVGKTRLALAVAEGLLAAYPDGIWLVELAPLVDPALVPGALAQVLGLREEPDRPLLQTLTDHLQAKQVLLVLDNCEHLLAACAGLANTLLRGCTGLRVLATNREGLQVAGERHYRVPSLSVPDPRHLPPAELAGSYEAVRLFMERIQERRDDFALTSSNARAIAEVCARLDGVPLAIELAAARAGSMPVEAIATRLDERFRLLTGGPRDLPSRQRTLRAALDWSWDLLAEEERTLLARLSVFAGGWTLEAAETVCAGGDINPWIVLDGLDALVNKSLVQVDTTRERVPDEQVPGEEAGRYRLLETVRQYAAEHLGERGEGTEVRDRHLAWSLDLAERAYHALRGPEQQVWLARLEREHDNLRAALRWASAEGQRPAELATLACNIYRFWFLRGHGGESGAWLSLACAADGIPPALRARSLATAGFHAWSLGEYAQARVLLDESVSRYRELGDRKSLAGALQALAHVVERQGDYPRAVALLEESLPLCEDSAGTAMALGILGQIAERQGDLERATDSLERSLHLLRQIGDTAHVAEVLGTLGSISRQQGANERAAALLEEGLAIHRELGDRWNTARELHALGMVRAAQGEHGRATALLRDSASVFRALEDRAGLVDLLEDLAGVVGAQQQAHLGARLLGAAVAGREAIGAPLPAGRRALYERTRAELAALLGEELFGGAWAEGRTLGLDDAITLALEDHPSPEQS